MTPTERDELAAAIREHFVAALATARADVAAYERALDVPADTKPPDFAWIESEAHCALLGTGARAAMMAAHAQGAGSIALGFGEGGGLVATCDPAIYAQLERVAMADAERRGVTPRQDLPDALRRAADGDAGELHSAKSDCWLCESLPDGCRCGDPKCGPYPDASGSAGR